MNKLAIVILHYNTAEDVSKNLETLSKAWLPEKTEIVVVNNGGHKANDKIPKHLYENLNVRFFDIPNNGYPQGNNFGVSKTNAEYINILNPDIFVDPDTYEILFDYMKKHKNVGIVSPRLIYKNGKIQDNYRIFPRALDLIIKRTPFLRKRNINRMKKYLMWEKDPEKNETVDWVTGAFQIITRECWDAVGPNAERYFLFMSDVEICRDAWDKGFEVHFVGKAKALHNESRLSEGHFMDVFKKKTVRIHIKDAIKYFIKYFGKKLPKNCPSNN